MAYLPPLPKFNADGSHAEYETLPGYHEYTQTPLAAGAQWSSGWFPYGVCEAVAIVRYADVAGSSVFEVSADGGATVYPSTPGPYNDVGQFVVSIFPATRGTHGRFTFFNGPTAQSRVFLGVRKNHGPSTASITSVWSSIQPLMTQQHVHAVLSAPLADASPSPFGRILRVGNSLQVHQTNVPTLGTSYANVVGAGTTLIKSGTGRLRRVIVNGGGNSAAIYDSVTGAGPRIATVNLSAAFGTLAYDLPFANGLTLVTVGGSTDLTVVYD